jgi:hypothetical protein
MSAAGRQLTSMALNRVRRGVNRFGWSFVAMFAVLIVGRGALTRIVDSARALPVSKSAQNQSTARPTPPIPDAHKASMPTATPASSAEPAAAMTGIRAVPATETARPTVSTLPSAEERQERREPRTGSGRKLADDWSRTN